jgi:hypothetical protein
MQPRLLVLVMTTVSVAITPFAIPPRSRNALNRLDGAQRHWLRGGGDCAVQQFVQLAPVKPNASASGAVIDLHALALCHDKGRIGARRAFHGDSFEWFTNATWSADFHPIPRTVWP